jgi:hypothetical protein
LLAVLGVLAAAAGCGRGPAVTVEVDRNVIVRSNFDFVAEHWSEPRLAQLAREERLDAIAAPDQLGHFLALTDWTHRQWPTSVPDPYPPCNAVDILREIRAGRTGGFCGQYAYVLADVLKASGYYAVRYVELWDDGGTNNSHFVVEAWCDEHAKWVVLDPHADLWYAFTGSGLPASAGEVRASLFGGPPVEARPAAAGGKVDPKRNLSLYANVAVSMRSDLMRQAAPLTVADRFATFLFYRDEHTRDFFRSGGRAGVPYATVTGRQEDVWFDCDRVRVEHRFDTATGEVVLELFTDGSMPNFRAFAASVDGGPWTGLAGNRLTLSHPGARQSVLVAPVNRNGRRGCVTTVTVTRS